MMRSAALSENKYSFSGDGTGQRTSSEIYDRETGQPDFEDMMMLEFPTFREARAWYDSPAYQAVSEHRFKGAECRAIIVEGVPPK